jgi:hypothetical protein
MRRGLWVAVVLVVGFGAYSIRPLAATTTSTEPEPFLTAPASVGCVVSLARGETGRVDVFGASTVTVRGATSAIGSGALTIEEVTPSGPGVALFELAEAGGGGTVVTGSDIASMAANCSPTSRQTIALSGVSTANGRQVELVVANPYALDAIVDVATISEVGPDTASELESLVVPAGSIVVRDLSRILPLRSHLSLVITPKQGSVHAVVYEVGRGATDRRGRSAPHSRVDRGRIGGFPDGSLGS